MKWAVVILKGKQQYMTMATVRYGYYGERNNQNLILCDTWQDGFTQARIQGFEYALFVKSGTAFIDWSKWSELLNNYPQQGLVGHIIWHPTQKPTLDDQCWFLDLNKFEPEDLSADLIDQPIPVRSDINLHDDYTPLWIKPSTQREKFKATGFGQGLISKQLNLGRPVMNWNNAARDLKRFEYQPGDSIEWFKEYINLAQTQLWVFNNEPITVVPTDHLITPGSGLYWILHRCNSSVKIIDIVDISYTQIDFCKRLLKEWDGTNYGQFVWDHIKLRNLVHYELDQANLQPIERLRFKKKQYFVDYVNSVFERLTASAGIVDFAQTWNNSQCQVSISWGNLAEYNVPPNARVWMSNILDYKYTLLTTDYNVLLDYEKTNKTN